MTKQEEMKKRFEKEFNSLFGVNVSILNSEPVMIGNPPIADILAFIQSEIDLAYNAGFDARTKETNSGKAMYERGRADERKECAKIVRDYIINDWSGEAEVYSEIEEIAKKIEFK